MTLNDEILDSLQKLEGPSAKLAQNLPRFIFGRLREDKESDRLIQEPEVTQDKIIHLLSSKNFLQPILEMFFPKTRITLNHNQADQSLAFTSEEKKQLPLVVSADIWNTISGENENFMSGFMRGMQDCQNNTGDSELRNECNYHKLKALKLAKENVEKADCFFSALDKDKNLILIEKGKIYVRTLQKGTGNVLSLQQCVTMHCKVKTRMTPF